MLLEQARDILQRMDGAVELVQRAQRGESGELRLGLTRATPLLPQIPRAIFAYRQQYPQVQMQLREMNSLRQIDALLADELDVGIIRKRVLPDELVAKRLFDDPLALVVHATHPAVAGKDPSKLRFSLRQFALDPFVGFSRDAGAGIHDHVITLCRNAGFSPRIVQEAGESSTLISLVAAGFGVCVLPSSCTHIQVDGACFVALSDRGAASEIQLAWRRESVTPLLRQFIALLKREVAG
ncbi:HTH-type transcriptional regulator BenM [compost metagenome]